MNSVCVTGRLTKDPVIRGDEKKVAFFSVAVRKRFVRENDRDSDFFDVVAYGSTVTFIEKYITKGIKVEITGRLEQNQYTDKEGNRRTQDRIIAESVEFAESKGSHGGHKPDEPPTVSQAHTAPPIGDNENDFFETPGEIEDELPF
jgi:single-strand DNA-binding protein